MKNIFVTAIDTDSGKTAVSAILAKAWDCNYWKPVQSGEPTDSNTIRTLLNNEIKIFPEAYKLNTPASPHYAAEVDSVDISLDDIELPKSDKPLIIEGAGGLMVPLNKDHLMIDLIKKFDCKVVLVSNIYLGNINHTLLSVEALKNRGIEVDYLVFNGEEMPSTESIIEHYTNIPVLFRMRKEEQINYDTIKKYAEAIRNEY